MKVEGRKGRKWVRERSVRGEKAGRVEGVNNYVHVVIVIQTLMLDNFSYHGALHGQSSVCSAHSEVECL